MALPAADLGGTATIGHEGYSKPRDSLDQNALSAYDLAMAPGGSFAYLAQEVLVGRNEFEVEYYAAIEAAAAVAGLGSAVQATPVDLGSVGDNAGGELLTIALATGQTVYEAVVVLFRGRYLDFVVAASTSQLSATDVQSLAQAAASRLNAGLGG
jgi:hypothetical protein